MSAAQRGIWYAHQFDSQVPLSVAAFFELRGHLDVDAMAKAVHATASHTESGLLRVVETDAEPELTIDTARDVEVQFVDLRGSADPRAAALDWMNTHRTKPVDLLVDPLLETYLLELGDQHRIWYCWGHHLAFDGYGAMLMTTIVAQHYSAIVEGRQYTPPASATMQEITEDDATYRASDAHARDREFWQQQLHGIDADVVDTARASLWRPEVTQQAGTPTLLATTESAELSADLATALRETAQRLGIRPASVISAAVAHYLAALTGRDHTMISLPVAARTTDVLRTSAGMTSNVLPVAISTPPEMTVADLFTGTDEQIKNAVRHQRFRHEDINRDLLDDNGTDRGFYGPMVNVMLFFSHIDFGPVHGEVNLLSTGPVEDLSFNVYEKFGTNDIRFDLEANPNRYSRQEVRLHHRRVRALLQTLLRCDPMTRLSQVDTLMPDERRRVFESWNDTAVTLPPTTLPDLLDTSRRENARRPALRAADADPGSAEQFSHADLHCRSDHLAHQLIEAGVGPDSVVAVMMSRSVSQVVALHAVIKAGGAYLPINPDDPAGRIDHMLTTAEPALILVGPEHPAPATTVPVITVDSHSPATGPSTPITDADRRTALHPDHPAYVIFTSGSTGKPKGVSVSHRAICNRLLWMQHEYPIGAGDRVIQKTPATFDVSVWEFFWPFISGAELIVPSADGHRDPWYLREMVNRHGITVAHFVPSMLAAFVAALEADATDDLASLRQVFTSGEALQTATAIRWQTISSAPVHNLYGPTEAAVDVTYQNNSAECQSPSVPIGRPVWNTTVHVLDRQLRPQATGAVGELYLAGDQLARGYIGRPDLTADRFIANPYAPGQRMYRSGDLVRRRADGAIEYIGRSDFQVKIRGQRIELGEVRAALASLDPVSEAAVVIHTDPATSHPMLVGYVTGPGPIDVTSVREDLRSMLPEFMVPAVIVELDRLPTTANGKLDGKALPDPVFESSADEHRAPADELETALCGLFSRVLGRDTVSASASFFDLGGNSLLATKVVARLSAMCGHRIGIKTLFDSPTPVELAVALRELGVDDSIITPDRKVTAIPRAPADAVRIPLSAAQQRVWFLNRSEPESGAYNIPFQLTLSGRLDHQALRRAVSDLVERQQILRTVFPTDAEGPYQQVRSIGEDDLELELDELTVDAVDADRLTRELAAEGFDLAEQIPIRVRLLRLDDRRHRLVIVIHHIAADGLSLIPLATDLATAYRARHSGHAPTFAELPVQYTDFSHWQAQQLESAPLAAQLGHWAEVLADLPAETELPRDRPRPARPTLSAGGHTLRLGPDVHRGLADLAGGEQTLFTVVHALIAVLLRRMSTDDDVVIGTPVGGRGDDSLDDLVGMFVNTVVLRAPVSKSDTFTDIVAALQQTTRDALAGADVPFERVVTELNPDRTSSAHPLFQVSLALNETTEVTIDLPELDVEATPVPLDRIKFDLQFTLTPHVGTDGEFGEIDVDIDYAAELFDHATIRDLGTRLERLARGVLSGGRQAIGDINILGRGEKLSLVPASGPRAPRPRVLPDILATAVHENPDAIAVRDSNGDLSYAELDARSDALAHLLIDAGVGPEDFVAVSIPRSSDWIVALWATAKTGAAWVPVDPRYPRARIDHILTDSGARLCLTVTDSPTAHPDTPTIAIDHPDLVERLRTAPRRPVRPGDRLEPLGLDNPAYLIYTSGTTGTPKGVVVSHHGLVDFTVEQVHRFSVEPDSVTLHFASPSFDASVLEVLMAVGGAATMVIASPDVLGGNELQDLLAAHQVTHAFVTPSVLATMDPNELPDLSTVIVGGEHPNREVIARWSADRRLFNAYGPTEATVVATISDPIEPGSGISMGGPVRGMDVLVLDERLQPVPVGAVGELYLAGGHLARGYHGRTSRTSQSFLANPFGADGDRMYRTGDLVRWTAGAELEFMGRADSQVKVRGFRIEVGEIDAALVRYEQVAEAVTVARPASDDSTELVSYVSPVSGQTLTPEDLRERLTAQLPAHMIPRAIVVIDAMPTTPAGKIDFRSLPEPSAVSSDATEHGGAPRGPRETEMAEIFADITGYPSEQIGRGTDFFEMGGNSLMATQVVARLETRLGHRIPVRMLFDNPTVARMARAIGDSSSGSDGSAPLPELVRKPRPDTGRDSVPAPAATRLWFLNRLDPASGAYNIAAAVTLRGEIDVKALQDALGDLIERHEPLRTIYPEDDGRPQVEVLAAPDAVLPFVDLTGAAAPDDDLVAAQTRLVERGFDLRTDPPLRAELVAVAPNHHVLTLVIHHIAADGWSLGPLSRDLAAAYSARRRGHAPAAPPLPVRYRDYAEWHHSTLGDAADPTSRAHLLLEWWTQRLADTSGHTRVRETPTGETGSGSVDFTVDADLVASLSELAHARDASLFMVVHSALAALLHRSSADPAVHLEDADSDVIIGSPVAGRDHPDLAGLVGMFVNTVVLRTPVTASDSFTDLIARVRDVDIDAFSHADMPYDQLAAAVTGDRRGGDPLVQVALAFADDDGPELDFDGVETAVNEISTAGTRFDLELRVSGPAMRMTFARQKYTRPMVEVMTRRLVRILESVAADPDMHIGDIDLSTDVEPCAITGPTIGRSESGALLADLLADAVDRDPEAPAVVFDATTSIIVGHSNDSTGDGDFRSLSYRVLDEWSNRWARYLLSLEIGPEDIVPIAVNRGPASVAAIWAVTKTGAAFAPIDPSYPTQRIEHMIADCGATIGLTDEATAAGLPAGVRWISLDGQLGAAVETMSGGRLRGRPQTSPDNIAYVIYTSGSTGTPKGVAVTHRGLAPLAAEHRARYGVDSTSRTLHFASPSFDASVLELLLAVPSGACMVIAPQIYGGTELETLLRTHRITHAFITPAALSTVPTGDLPDLRTLAVGGEACGPELIEKWAPGRTFLNAYGPTETSIVSLMATLEAGATAGNIPIGTPVRGERAVVLDSRLRPVPRDVPGELYLGGAGLARGYLGRADLTAARFIADPGGRSGEVLYRTGDVVTADSDGVLTYLGRSDHQVKMRGFRIELGEINAVLTEHPDVRSAATVVRGHGEGATLAAYVVAGSDISTDGATDTAGVRRLLEARLPRHQVPSSITVIDEIPRTPNGKLDTDALPAPAPTATTAQSRAITGETQKSLAALFADVLGIPGSEIGADHSFFDLGGTSLTATQLVSRINRDLDLDLPVRAIFDNPTVDTLARLAADRITSDRIVSAPMPQHRIPLTARDHHEATAPVSLAQRRLWFLANAEPESTAYNIPFSIEFDGDLSVMALQSAIVDVLHRHESLRTRFPEVDGEPVQVPQDDATTIPALRAEPCDLVERDDLVLETATQRFDLAADAPIRFRLLRTGPLSHTLIIVVHHIAADGWSLPTLLADLMTAYRARIDGGAPPFDPLPVSYIDHTLWQRATVGSPDDPDSPAHRQLEFWREVLSGAPTDSTIPSLAEDSDTDRALDHSGGTITLSIDDDLRGAIADLAHSTGVSPFMLMHAALATLMYRMGAGRDIVIGTPVGGRFEPEIQSVVGMFVNTLALRSTIDPAASFTDFLSVIRDGDLEALTHVDVPFEDVVAAINPERAPRRHPLFQVALSVHDWSEGTPGGDLDAGHGLSAQVREIDSAGAKFDLQFTVTGLNPGAQRRAQVTLTYARARYSEQTAESIAARLIRTLRAVTDVPHRPVGDTPVTDFVEEATLAPVRGLPAPIPRPLADLFTAAAFDNPEGTALIDAHHSVSYREVDVRSNRLARLLLRRGLSADALVAMAIPRSVDAVIATIAISKTGAAFLPVDPGYPAGRIEHMLSDSRARVGITLGEHLPALPAAVDWFVLDDPAVHDATEALSALPLTRAEVRQRTRDDQLSYIIYTSGSTGRPKGVMVPHRGLTAVHDELKASMSPESSSRVLHFASPSFDASILELLMSISGRASLVIAPTDVYGGDELADFLERSAVTHAFITPAALASLDHRRALGLRTIAVGGEAVGSELVNRWSVDRTLLNVYGPTETTIIATGSAPLSPGEPVTIGSPNRGVRALVLDSRLHPTPVGVAGELYLVGDQVTRGYHGRPGLTAGRFVANPTGVGGERMYRTGDVVRWTQARTLHYLGRSDDQIQIRGFRVELGEIDAMATSFEGVKYCATIVDTTDSGDRLLSYVVPVTGSDIDPAELRTDLAHRLPRHMVPAVITVLDKIPLTPTGKLDKKALPRPVHSTPAGRAPADGTETLVAQAFCAVLDVESVSATDSFFDLGGNSLLATKVVATLRDDAGINIGVGILFTSSTPEELAAHIDRDSGTGTGTGELGAEPALAPMLALRAQGDRSPLFAIHPAMGVAWSYTALLPHLDADRPLYGLQNPALSGGPELGSVPDLAAHYLRQIRSIQPDGPYHLLGWSLGGSIAHEMAVQLQEQGERVDLLMLLDSYVVPARPGLDVAPSVRELLQEFGFAGATTSTADSDLSMEEALAVVARSEGPLAHLSATSLGALYDAYVAATTIAAHWVPRTYTGDAVFVSAAADQHPGGPASTDWGPHLTGHVDHLDIECRHSQMLDTEHAATIAGALGVHLHNDNREVHR